MTRDELIKKFPRASEAFIQANLERLRAADAERAPVVPLERAPSGKAAGRARLEVRFTCYSRRPCDWDNLRYKDCQDLLVVAGILDDDSHELLQGSVVSRKVHSAEEERTEVEIYEVIEGSDIDTL